MLGVSERRHRRAEDIRSESDRGSLIRAVLSREARAEHNKYRHHDRRRRQPRKTRADPRAHCRDNIQNILHITPCEFPPPAAGEIQLTIDSGQLLRCPLRGQFKISGEAATEIVNCQLYIINYFPRLRRGKRIILS